MLLIEMCGITVFRMDEYVSFLEVDLHELVRADPPPGVGGCPSATCGVWELGQCFEWRVVVCLSAYDATKQYIHGSGTFEKSIRM